MPLIDCETKFTFKISSALSLALLPSLSFEKPPESLTKKLFARDASVATNKPATAQSYNF